MQERMVGKSALARVGSLLFPVAAMVACSSNGDAAHVAAETATAATPTAEPSAPPTASSAPQQASAVAALTPSASASLSPSASAPLPTASALAGPVTCPKEQPPEGAACIKAELRCFYKHDVAEGPTGFECTCAHKYPENAKPPLAQLTQWTCRTKGPIRGD